MRFSLFPLFLGTMLGGSRGFTPVRANSALHQRVSVVTSMSGAAEPLAVAKDAIAGADIMVFSKSTCPFCARTKALFDELGVDYSLMELNEREDGAEVQAALAELTGQRTVPNVFIKGQHLGGNDDTQRANRDGTLLKMLA